MNTTEESTIKTIYQFFDAQTYNERRDFVKKVKEKNVSHNTLNNWVSKRCSIPNKYHQMLTELAGQKLLFPKLTRKVEVEPITD